MAHNKRSFNIQIFITKKNLLKIRDVAVKVFAKIYSKRSSAHDRYIYTRVYLRKYTTHTLADQLTFNVRIEWIFSPRVVCLLCKRAQCMCRAQHVSSTHTHASEWIENHVRFYIDRSLSARKGEWIRCFTEKSQFTTEDQQHTIWQSIIER